MDETTVAVDDLEEIDHLEKCTKQLVEIVVTSVRYHLCQKMLDLYIVMIALKIINRITISIKN
jgi:hypothetical protein